MPSAKLLKTVEDKQLQDYISPKCVSDSKLALAEAKDQASSVTLSLSTAEGDRKEIQRAMATSKAKVNEMLKKLRPQVASAEKESRSGDAMEDNDQRE